MCLFYGFWLVEWKSKSLCKIKVVSLSCLWWVKLIACLSVIFSLLFYSLELLSWNVVHGKVVHVRLDEF